MPGFESAECEDHDDGEAGIGQASGSSKGLHHNLRYAVVIMSAVLAGVALFLLGFGVVDFLWTHLVLTDPKEIGLGEGVMVVGGGFVIGSTLGLAGIVLVLYKFWPRRLRQ